jgi:transposase
MFIKEIKKKNQGSDKIYTYYRLMESYRTERGPRQRKLLDLGKLAIPKSSYKLLADTIEAIITGQKELIPRNKEIQKLAEHYARTIIRKGLLNLSSDNIEEKGSQAEIEDIDINTLTNSRVRTVGAEYIGHTMFRKLGLDKKLDELGFTSPQVKMATLSIIGRLVSPGSEKSIREWAQHLSGIEDLLDVDFSYIPNNSLYRISDLLLCYKSEIEGFLRGKERDLFSLEEKIILYDLTNTYFEGNQHKNPKARRGRSKEKRYDRPLVTLGLVIDEMGFPKTSRIFKGNISEPSTLLEIIESLESENIDRDVKRSKGITVLLDAGIATEDNLELIKSRGFDYVCVARNKVFKKTQMLSGEGLVTIKENKDNKIEVELFKKEEENILFCRSYLKKLKENSMRQNFETNFTKGLDRIKSSLFKKGGTKKYEKVIERIGRLKGKYASVARFYKIEVKKKGKKAEDINWKVEKADDLEERFSGIYFLRTSRKDLNEGELWNLYITLNHVEDAFRCLKDELLIRPNYHHKEYRVDAHIFITILAYHLLNSIQFELRKNGIYMSWRRIRKFLSNHVIVTTSMTTKKGRRLHIRNCSEPETFNKIVYSALGIKSVPVKPKKIWM